MNRSNLWSPHVIGICIVALILSPISSEARLGETSIQCLERYGAAKIDAGTKANDKYFPLLEGAIHKTYEYQGWKIRVAFLDLGGPAVRMEYKKISGSIRDFEVESILKAEGVWIQTPYIDPLAPKTASGQATSSMLGEMVGNKMWKREDGAIARLCNGFFIRLELPAAQQYEEQLKRAKEQKARASVPQF